MAIVERRLYNRKELWVLNLILVVNNQQSKLVNDAGSIVVIAQNGYCSRDIILTVEL